MIILDLETTGTNPSKHSIIDFATMDFDNPDYIFHMPVKLKPNSEVQQEALEYNGFTLNEIQDNNRPTIQIYTQRTC